MRTLIQFGYSDWKNLFGIVFTRSEERQVGDFSWDSKILQRPYPLMTRKGVTMRTVAQTHFAFVGRPDLDGKPLTMMRLAKVFPRNMEKLQAMLGMPSFQMDPIEDYLTTNRFSAKQTPELRWYLMPFQVHPGTLRENYEGGVEKLPRGYRVPYAIEEILKHFLCYSKTGEVPQLNRRALCRDLVSGGDRAAVGPFDPQDGLWVGGVWDNPRYDTGVASERIPGR